MMGVIEIVVACGGLLLCYVRSGMRVISETLYSREIRGNLRFGHFAITRLCLNACANILLKESHIYSKTSSY